MMNSSTKPESSAESRAIPVLLYHSVAEDPSDGQREYNATPDQFSQHVDAVIQSGRRVLPFVELGERLAARNLGAERVCAITFDDGFADNLAACRLLAERRVPATVFVTTSYVGKPGMLTPDELRQLAALPGIDVGAHSVSHPHLDAIDATEVEREVVQSRAALEEMLGDKVQTFAYPHGAYDSVARGAVESAGFVAAAAVKNALSHADDDPLAISRWSIETGVSLDAVKRVIDGDGAPLAWPGTRLRTRAARRARRIRQRLHGAAR